MGASNDRRDGGVGMRRNGEKSVLSVYTYGYGPDPGWCPLVKRKLVIQGPKSSVNERQ